MLQLGEGGLDHLGEVVGEVAVGDPRQVVVVRVLRHPGQGRQGREGGGEEEWRREEVEEEVVEEEHLL